MIRAEKMIKVVYLECPTGIAGDMCLGALVHAGVPVDYLAQMLNRLGIGHEYNLWAESVLRNGQQATKIHVELLTHLAPSQSHPSTSKKLVHFSDPNRSRDQDPEQHLKSHSHPHSPDHSHAPDRLYPQDAPLDSNQSESPDEVHFHEHSRHLPEIEALIKSAQLPERAEAWSLAVFRQLAAAEGAVHGISPQEVHFHEVGATDAIVDIVGTCLGLDWLNIERIYCSALPTGGGMIRAAHGLLPVPAPAVLKLWEMRQIPIYSNGILRELVTPTGAAIVTALATGFGSPPAMTLHRVGLGAGSRNLEIPNILRLWIGEQQSGSNILKPGAVHQAYSHAESSLPTPDSRLPTPDSRLPTPHSSLHPSHQTISMLETQIDDLSPQAIGYLYDTLFAAGALDVFTQAIGMKKSRLGVLLTVICPPEQADDCEAVIFRETTTLGIRRSTQQRSALPRTVQTVETPYGAVRIKVTDRGTQSITNGHPEYEDCARLARQARVAWQEVHRLALQCWYQTVDTTQTHAQLDD
jgi:pyridinium-3,5-bisthiocarboxylic acid mononucleotide nickel chelatase